MRFETIPRMLADIPGFSALTEFDQLSVTEVAMAAAQTEYNRQVSSLVLKEGAEITRIYGHFFREQGSECAVVGIEDLADTPNSPAKMYASAWKNGRLVALSATNAQSWAAALSDLEYKIVRSSDKAGEYLFPMSVFSSGTRWETYAFTLTMPALDLDQFKTPDEAREFVYREQSKQLLGWPGDIALLTKANGNCDNVMGRVARHLGNVLAESAMFEQQAISAARHEATQACQKFYAKSGKMASSWGAW